MDSSLILLAAVGLTAVGLVPHTLRRRQQLAECRSADRFSEAMRVLARRPVMTQRAGSIVHGTALLRSPRLTSVAPLRLSRPLSTTAVQVVGTGRPPTVRAGATGLLLASVLGAAGMTLLVVLTGLPLWFAGVGGGQLVLVLAGLRRHARRRSARRRGLLLGHVPQDRREPAVPSRVVVHEPVRERRPA